MTFYWWSHWFWITLICNLSSPHIMVVHTYPSQDSVNSTSPDIYPQTEQTKKLVTKLFQASTTQSWLTESMTMLGRTTAITEKSILKSVGTTRSPHTTPSKTFDYYYYDDDDDESENHKRAKPLDVVDVEEDLERRKVVNQHSANPSEEKLNEIKRSAENYSKDDDFIPASTTTSPPPQEAAAGTFGRMNNYTNFTGQLTNSTQELRNDSVTTSTTTFPLRDSSATLMAASASVLATSVNSLSANNVTALPHARPSTPKIVKSHNTAEDWLRTMDEIIAAVSPPTVSATTTTDVSEEKFPFTLENVHKSEDLRRDENEPRRRQSKGLSADFKPGYINYTPESKNLLTRSASTTVNDYDSEESNISSEALSVQRAYFMDVGAISAICFTVFGICCTVGTIGIVLYRRRFLNKPQALSEPDSSVYIDDSTMRVSDNSDEMYSLDNDSFLNSLEAMTIQNYWTDTVKHTKL
uniref:Uncharacterized protein n=1 Tax=Stomoxys calcitrans TaxID=35570 RepID=A0A1I8PJH8_STOCA